MIDYTEPVFGEESVSESREKAAGFDARSASDDELFTTTVVLTKLESLVAGIKARALAELDARKACDREKGSPTGAWLAAEAGIPTGVARRQVNVARKLRALPEVDAALLAGRISSHHAGVLAEVGNPRVADAVAAMQGTLLGLIEGATFTQWRAEVRDLVNAVDQDGGYDPRADQDLNRLDVVDTIDGITYVRGQFVGDAAAIVKQATKTLADELFRLRTTDQEQSADLVVPDRSNLQAEAWVELARRGMAVDLHATRSPRPEVTLVIRAEDPDDGPATPTSARLQDGTTRTLRCDPDIFAVIVNRLGEPIDLGRRARLASPAQRRALVIRDGGCVFPGCDRPLSWCDAHHVDHFEHGGRTDLANLASLCRHHHGVSHRRGWEMHATDDGWFHWRTPSGQTMWSQRHGRRRDGPAPAEKAA